MTEETKADFLCFICGFIALVLLTFCIIGEDSTPQQIQIVNTQKGSKSVK